MKNKNAMSTNDLVMYALLTAIVIVLQVLGSFIKFGPFSVSLVLAPIIIGAALGGEWLGAWLGLIFGVTVLFTDSAAFLAVNPLGTALTVIVKGILAGYVSGLTYKLLAEINGLFAVIVSGIVSPVVNTGVFLVGCKLFFMPLITEWAKGLGFGDNVGKYMIFGLVGTNFLVELAVNLLLSTTILRLLKIRKER